MRLDQLHKAFKPKLSGLKSDEWTFIQGYFELAYPEVSLNDTHKYIYYLVSKLYKPTGNNLNVMHIQIPVKTDSHSNEIGLFLMVILRFFEFKENLKKIEPDFSNDYYYINNRLNNPKSLKKLLSKYSTNLSGQSSIFNILFKHEKTSDESKSKSEIYDRSGLLTGEKRKKIIEKKKKQNEVELLNYNLLSRFIEFYCSSSYFEGIQELNLYPTILFTCLTGYNSWINNNYAHIWNSCDIENINTNDTKLTLNDLRPILTNSTASYNDFYNDDGQYKINNKSIFYDLSKTIVLFNTVGRSKYNGFNYERLTEHVEEYDGKIKRLLIINFNKGKFYSYIKNFDVLEKIKDRYKINMKNNSITIDPLDIQNEFNIGKIHFDDIDIYYSLSSFYDILFLKAPETYSKYLSIWFLNILSNVYSKAMQEITWKKISSQLSNVDKLDDLKEVYINLTNTIINRNRNLLSTFSKKTKDSIKISKRVLVPSIFLKDSQFNKSLLKLKNEFRITFIDWNTFKSTFEKDTQYLILDYRDSGFDHKLNFNIFDLVLNSKNIKCHFISDIFKKRFFLNTKDYLQKVISTILLSDTRISDFRIQPNSIKEIINQISNEIPSIQSIDNDFNDIDDTDYEPPSTENIKIYFEGKQHTFNKSEKLLIRNINNPKHYILRAENLLDKEDINQIEGQRIYDLYEKLELFEDKKSDKDEIAKFKSQLKIDLPEDQWLWKHLLKNKVNDTSLDFIYNELDELSKSKGFFLVSKKTFLSSYMDSKNPTLPREKKATRAICEYLNLPPAYYRLIIRYKARQVLKSRKSNAKMDRLISSLIEFNLFPTFNSKNYPDWFKHINANGGIDLEDLGIFENEKSEIEILVEFLKEKLNTRRIKKIKLVSND